MNVRSYIAFCISKVAPCSGRFMCNTLKLVLSIVQSSPFFWRVFCKGCLFGFAAFAAFAFAFVAFALLLLIWLLLLLPVLLLLLLLSAHLLLSCFPAVFCLSFCF